MIPGELVVGRYRAGEEIGRGGMGIVFRALDIQLNRPVALKMLLPQSTDDSGMRRRLESEARTASGLNHPGIATVFDFVETADATFIVYELVGGRTLRSEMAVGRFTMEELLNAGVQLADALAAAHQEGGFFAVSCGLTRKIEFACDEVNDAGEVSVRAIASSFGFGGLNETVNAFEDAVADLGGEPA